MKQPKIGLLPLYLKLYDEIRAQIRDAFTPFLDQVQQGFEAADVAVVRADICRLEAEFEEAIALLEREGVDLIVTLHLAYSTSGESIGPLCRTELPILMLDTTMDHYYGRQVDQLRMMYNHGIHGVQDLATMFRRRGRPFQIVAGHVPESDALARAANIAQAALAANELRGTKTLRVGKAFHGMEDFAVAEDVLASSFGITVEQLEPADLGPLVEAVTDAEVEAEMALDHERYEVAAPEDVHRRSVRLGLGLRSLLEDRACGGFSVCFLEFDSPDEPISTVPFLEAGKALTRGIGYAGEGDVLTAALVGALARGFGDTTFTELFCPDWRGNSLFISHMGEFNPAVAAGKAVLREKDYPFSDAQNPAFFTGAPRPGPAVLVNLAPGPDDSFRLIAAPVEVLKDSTRQDAQSMIRGWLRSSLSTAAFLEEYSRLGGTHHSALVLGDKTEAIRAFAAFVGIECCVLK